VELEPAEEWLKSIYLKHIDVKLDSEGCKCNSGKLLTINN